MPGFDLLAVLVLVVFAFLVFVEVIVVVIRVVHGMFENVTARHFVTYDAGSAGGAVAAAGVAAGAGAVAGFGGGYVVQK